MAEPRPQFSRVSKMADVLPPEKLPGEGELPKGLSQQTSQKEAVTELQKARTPWFKFTPELRKTSRVVSVLFVVCLLGFVVMRFSSLQSRAAEALAAAREVAKDSVAFGNLPELRSDITGNQAQNSFIGTSSASLNSLFKKASISDLWTLFTQGGETLNRFQKTIADYKSLTEEVAVFLNRVPGVFFEPEPGPLPALESIQARVARFEASNSDLSSSLGSVKGALPVDFSDYVAMGKNLNQISDLLDTGIQWLQKPRRVIVAFQNSSEMRPSGGFFGSYAELSFVRGRITDIQVRDVTEADKQFSESIVPPQPLQFITKNWRAADANWYFDFQKSASNTISFLEKSDLYKASSTRFDGMIALSPRVLEDILDITGPIELKDRKLILTSKNFLEAIQEDVVSERSKSAEAPKSILADIVLVMRDRLLRLPQDQRSELSTLFTDWIRYKDVQISMKDEDLQSIVRFLGADGSVIVSSPTQNVDYIAIVDSTIGGEKTNYVMDRTISLRAQIEADGRVSHKLNITRTHKGDKETERWYKMPNRNYMKILMPAGSQILGASGFEERKPAVRTYDEEYIRDLELTAYESTFKTVLGIPSLRTFEESGKMGAAGWTITEAGKQTKVVLDYDYRLPEKPETGTPYRFVFEKQAGTKGSYSFEIGAPVGYHFKETKLPIFDYKTEDIPGRVVIDLTLEKT